MKWIGEPVLGRGVCERRFDVECQGRTVPSLLWTPESGVATGLVLLGHGGTTDKRADYVLSLARRLVRHHSLAALSIDGPGHGERRPEGAAPLDQGAFEKAWQGARVSDEMVADWKASLDAIQKLDEIGPGPVGYWGLSMGTMFGVPLVAAEPRICVAVLGLMGIRDDAGPLGERFLRDAPEVRCPVLFLQQWDDELIPVAASNQLFGLIASKDKRLHAHPGRHAAVPPEEFTNSESFLAQHLRAAK